MHLSALGVELAKIRLLVRWASALIIHYARIAPLRSITDDFKRKHQNSGFTANQIAEIEKELDDMVVKAIEDKAAVKHSDQDIRVRAVMNKFNKQHEALRDELSSLIKDVEAKCSPTVFALNIETNKAHKILAAFDEVGSMAK